MCCERADRALVGGEVCSFPWCFAGVVTHDRFNPRVSQRNHSRLTTHRRLARSALLVGCALPSAGRGHIGSPWTGHLVARVISHPPIAEQVHGRRGVTLDGAVRRARGAGALRDVPGVISQGEVHTDRVEDQGVGSSSGPRPSCISTPRREPSPAVIPCISRGSRMRRLRLRRSLFPRDLGRGSLGLSLPSRSPGFAFPWLVRGGGNRSDPRGFLRAILTVARTFLEAADRRGDSGSRLRGSCALSPHSLRAAPCVFRSRYRSTSPVQTQVTRAVILCDGVEPFASDPMPW